jgi:hypothetical protein
MPARSGTLDKGPFRSRQVGARTFAAPQWSNLKPRAGFGAGNPEPHLGITLNNLEIYETNTSNQSQPACWFSVNRLQLSSDSGCKEHRRSTDREADRFSQIKQRFSRHRSGPRLCRGIFSVHCDRLDLGLADSFQHCSRGSDGARLLIAADILIRNAGNQEVSLGSSRGERLCFVMSSGTPVQLGPRHL